MNVQVHITPQEILKSTIIFQYAMQQTQHNRDSEPITPPITLEIVLASGGLLVGEKDGLVTVATMGEVKIDTPVGTGEQRIM